MMTLWQCGTSLFYNLLQFLPLFPPAADTEYSKDYINTKGWFSLVIVKYLKHYNSLPHYLSEL